MPKVPKNDWTEDELIVCVLKYRQLQLDEAAGLRLNKKATMQDTVADELPKRTTGAYRFRMSNISALLQGLGLPILNGYPPRQNVGPKVTAALLRMINDVWERQHMLEEPTADPEALKTRVSSARSKVTATPPPVNPLSGRKVQAYTERFIRDPNVIAWVLDAAAGHCEACGHPAPFLREDGEPYLEVHHVRPLSEGGPDSADNAVGVCPTCHRTFHHSADKDQYRRKTLKRVGRLVNHPRLTPDLDPE